MSDSAVQMHHLAIVVEDLDSALDFWGGALGLPAEGGVESLDEEAVDVVFLRAGEARVELIQPRTDDSGVAKFLAKRGPGLHHLCLEVADLDATLAELEARGVELINATPRVRDGRRYAFAHPKSAGGVLLELYEKP